MHSIRLKNERCAHVSGCTYALTSRTSTLYVPEAAGSVRTRGAILTAKISARQCVALVDVLVARRTLRHTTHAFY